MLSRFQQRHIQQRGQATTGFDLGTGPLVIIGPTLLGLQFKLLQIDLPDRLSLRVTGKIEKEDAIEPLGAHKLRWQFGDVVTGRDQEHIGRMVVHPGQQRAEKASRHPTIALAAETAERLFDLVDEADTRSHAVSDLQSPANVRFRLTDERTEQGTDIQ